MKKMVIAALLMVCLATVLAGCANKEEPKENTQVENNVEKEVSEKTFAEFIKVLEANNTLEIKKFILDNIQKVDEKTADKMVMKYEILLKDNFDKLSKKFNSMEYFGAVNDTMDENYELNLESIKDENIKKEVMDAVASGYTFESLEGSYYLTMDYSMINDTFGTYLSENVKPYYELRKKELEKPTFVEEYVSIDFEEIKNRAVTLEKFIRDNKDYENKKDLEDMMRWYVDALLRIDHFGDTVDYETGKVNAVVKKTYEELKSSDLKILKHVSEEMDNLLSEYKYVLKSDDQEGAQKINELRFKLSDEVAKKIEEYYY
ncbi:hypothetical protein [Tepidibacter hydrothermalis]|uniref:Lipoprotein n=1 Tax=Tepidibacter hydrothermalis TaxID=3036126 RepID=A0ABY8E8J6_9FIRM|nr:hypothetical protein [Tepidibacter hydrothermalis]WFD09231.1 hypothetical protein P4S50_12645 [Tepidibacter hydrothermalis]